MVANARRSAYSNISLERERFGGRTGVSRVMPPITYHGLPRSSEDWAALAKIASGHAALSKEELRRLFMLGLVERQLGRICLSPHGRITLGLPHPQHLLPGAGEHPQLDAR